MCVFNSVFVCVCVCVCLYLAERGVCVDRCVCVFISSRERCVSWSVCVCVFLVTQVLQEKLCEMESIRQAAQNQERSVQNLTDNLRTKDTEVSTHTSQTRRLVYVSDVFASPNRH